MKGISAKFMPSPAGKVQVWGEPLIGHSYVAGIDVAEGKIRDRGLMKMKPGLDNERPDYSCAIVIDQETTQHVASWHGYMEPIEFSFACAAIGIYYNQALLVPEINGPGLVIVETLSKTISYPNLYRSKVVNRIDHDGLGSEFGWRTTQTSRNLLIAAIQRALMLGTLTTMDEGLVAELRTMEFDEQGVARARGRKKDDRVLALGLALQARDEMVSTGAAFALPAEQSKLPPDDRYMWALIHEHKKRQARDRELMAAARRGSAWR